MRPDHSGREQPPSGPDARMGQTMEAFENSLPIHFKNDGTRSTCGDVTPQAVASYRHQLDKEGG